MKICFNRDILTIRLKDKELPSYLIEEVITAHKSNVLLFENSVILLFNASLTSIREGFLGEIGKRYANAYNYDTLFFTNSLKKIKSKTIKLDIIRTDSSDISVEVSDAGKYLVNISIDAVGWIAEYLYELLRPHGIRMSPKVLTLDIRHGKAMRNLQKILGKKMIFGYKLTCKYHDSFFDTVSEFYMMHDFGDQLAAKTILEAYAALNCHIGSSKETVRRKYRQLARTYHPDRVYAMRHENNYTVRFQHLQNAYAVLKSELF